MKKNLFLLIIFFSCVNLLESKILRYKYFAESQRINGGCGKIYSLSSYILEKNKVLLTLHKFDIALSYGAIENAEIGIFSNLNDLQNFSDLSNSLTKIYPYLQYKILNTTKDAPFDMSLSFFNTSGIIVIQKLLPYLWSTSVLVNLNFSLEKEKKFFYTYSISKYTKWVEFIIDINATDEKYSFGLRPLLTPQIKLDLFFLDLKNMSNILFDSFIFGITIKF